MPEWIHNRAQRILESTRKQYGSEKGKEVAFALATQQAHATGKAPKKWHGETFGTPEGKREAKEKYDEPSKMQKSADGPVGFTVYDHTGQGHWLDAASIKNKTDLEKAVAPLLAQCPHGTVRQKIEEAWSALSEHRKSQQPAAPPPTRSPEKSASAGRYMTPTELINKWLGREKHASPMAGRDVPPRVIAQDPKANAQQGLAPSSSGMSITTTSALRPRWTVEDAVGLFDKKAQDSEEELARRHEEFLHGGRSAEEGTNPEDFDPDQIQKGLKVEEEHTPVEEDQLKILLDHLTEDPRYYDDPMFKTDLEEKAAARADGQADGVGARAERTFAGSPAGYGLLGALAGGASGASTMGLPGALGGAAAGGLAGLLGGALHRKIRGRALLGRLRRGEGLMEVEKRKFEEAPGREGEDHRTFPISRFLTSPTTSTVAGGLSGAVGGAGGGYTLGKAFGADDKQAIISALLGAAAGGTLGGAAGHLTGQVMRSGTARGMESAQEQRRAGTKMWYPKEEQRIQERQQRKSSSLREDALFPVIPHFLESLGRIEKLAQVTAPTEEEKRIREKWAQANQGVDDIVDTTTSFLNWMASRNNPPAPTGQQIVERAAETGKAVGQQRLEDQLAQAGVHVQ